MKWSKLLRANKIIVTADGFWSNGHIAIKGDPPERALHLKTCYGVDNISATISDLIPDDHLKYPVLEILDGPDIPEKYLNSKTGGVIKTSLLKIAGGGVEIPIQTEYYRILKYFIKEPFIFLVHDKETVVICENPKGEILAVIMPVKIC